jgi:hypothetical protein
MIKSKKDVEIVLGLIKKHQGSKKTSTMSKSVYEVLVKNLTQGILDAMVSRATGVRSGAAKISESWVNLSEQERMLVIDELSDYKQ